MLEEEKMYYENEYDEGGYGEFDNVLSDYEVNRMVDGIVENSPRKQKSVIKEMLEKIFRSYLNYSNKFSQYGTVDNPRFVFNVVNKNSNNIISLNINFDYKLSRLSIYLEIPTLDTDNLWQTYIVKILTGLLNTHSESIISMFKPEWVSNCWGGFIDLNNDNKILISGINGFKDIAEHSVILPWIIAAVEDEDKLFYFFDADSYNPIRYDDAFMQKSQELNKKKSQLVDYLTNPSNLKKAQKDVERWKLYHDSDDYDSDDYGN